MKKRFGKDPGRRPSKEDIEREAAEELNRLTGRGGPPPASWGAPPAASREEPPDDEPRGRAGPSREERFRAELRRLRREPAPRPSREDIEREAAEELSRLTGRSGPPPESWGAAPSAPAREEPRPERLRPVPPAPPAAGWDDAPDGPGGFEGGYGDELTAEEEEELITEMALSDLAERSGRRPEDFAIARVDPSQVAAARDRALQEILERQARIQRDSQAKRKPRPGGGSPLDQVADTFGAVPAGKAFTPLSVSMMPASAMAAAGFAGSAQKRRIPRDSALRRSPPPEQAEPEKAEPARSATRWAKAGSPTARRKPAVAKGAPAARQAKAAAGAAAPAARLAKAGPAKESPARSPRPKAAPAAAEKAAAEKPAAVKKPAGVKKPAAAKRGAAKEKAAAEKPAATKRGAAAEKAAAEKPAAVKQPAAAKRAAVKQPAAAKRAAAKQPAAAKRAAVKQPAASKEPAASKKPAASTTGARKAPARRPPQ